MHVVSSTSRVNTHMALGAHPEMRAHTMQTRRAHTYTPAPHNSQSTTHARHLKSTPTLASASQTSLRRKRRTSDAPPHHSINIAFGGNRRSEGVTSERLCGSAALAVAPLQPLRPINEHTNTAHRTQARSRAWWSPTPCRWCQPLGAPAAAEGLLLVCQA